jgi:hypothetical protein
MVITFDGVLERRVVMLSKPLQAAEPAFECNGTRARGRRRVDRQADRLIRQRVRL